MRPLTCSSRDLVHRTSHITIVTELEYESVVFGIQQWLGLSVEEEIVVVTITVGFDDTMFILWLSFVEDNPS